MDDTTRRDALVAVAAGAAVAVTTTTGSAAQKPGDDAKPGAEGAESKHDIRKLDGQLQKLGQILTRLGETKDVELLRRIIIKRGWTTPAEFTLVSGVVDTLITQAGALVTLKQVLVKGANEVVAK